MNRTELSHQLSKTERVPNTFANELVNNIESEIDIWETLDTPFSARILPILRSIHRGALKLIHGVTNGTDPVTQAKIDKA